MGGLLVCDPRIAIPERSVIVVVESLGAESDDLVACPKWLLRECYHFVATTAGRIRALSPAHAAVYSSEAFWLILPVVICLSQRLSHACLSSHSRTVKPRMAH